MLSLKNNFLKQDFFLIKQRKTLSLLNTKCSLLAHKEKTFFYQIKNQSPNK